MGETLKQVLERTDYHAITREPVMVTLGGEQLPLTPQSRRHSARFRHALATILKQVQDVSALADVAVKLASQRSYEIQDLPLPVILKFVIDFLEEGSDRALDLIYEYDPAFQDEKVRNWIEDNATEAEIVAVIARIFDLVFRPLVQALPAAIGVGGAPAADSTGPSETNGTTGNTKPSESPGS